MHHFCARGIVRKGSEYVSFTQSDTVVEMKWESRSAGMDLSLMTLGGLRCHEEFLVRILENLISASFSDHNKSQRG